MRTISRYYTLLLRNPLNRLVLALVIGAGAGIMAGAGFAFSPFVGPSDVPVMIRLWAGCVVPPLFFVMALILVNHRDSKQFSFREFCRWSCILSVLWGAYALAAPILAVGAVTTLGLAMILPLWALIQVSSYAIRRVWSIPKAAQGWRTELLHLVLSLIATAYSIGLLMNSGDWISDDNSFGFQVISFLLFFVNYPLLIGGITYLLLLPRKTEETEDFATA